MRHLHIFILLLLLTVSSGIAQTIQGTYAIKNVKTGMLLRIKDANSKNGTPIVGYNPQNWKCMTWDFKSTGGNNYQLENLFSHKTLQPAGAAEADIKLEEQPLVSGNASQEYEFMEGEKGVYTIKLKGSDLFLTAADEVNDAITLAKKSNDKDQFWTIYKQNPTM